jgi:hypothetical protein
VLFIFARDSALAKQVLLKPELKLPYFSSINPAELDQAVIFGHTLTEQLNGQMAAGFHT